MAVCFGSDCVYLGNQAGFRVIQSPFGIQSPASVNFLKDTGRPKSYREVFLYGPAYCECYINSSDGIYAESLNLIIPNIIYRYSIRVALAS